MQWKKIGKRILFPPFWLVSLLTVVCAVSLTYVFIKGLEESILAYGIYALSFYTLCVVCTHCIWVLPGKYRQIRQQLYADPLANRFLTDNLFKARMSLHLSLSINLLYAIFQGLQWFLFRSWWFVVLAGYYCILSILRFELVHYVHHHAIGGCITAEWKKSRSSAFLLLLVNLTLTGAVLMILFQNRGYAYHGVLIYGITLYTFYSVIHSITQIIRYRKIGSPILSTAKVVSLSAAVVSMLNLETAMLSEFGADLSPESKKIFIILTGAGVSVIIVTMSLALIVRSTREIRSVKNGK